jgi:hypothetical protein
MSKPSPTFVGGLVAIAVCLLIGLLVVWAPWLAAILFLAGTVTVFFVRGKASGFKKAAIEAVKKLLTGW